MTNKSDKPRVVVLEFMNKTDTQWRPASSDLMQDVFITELVKSGKFEVVGRKQLQTLLQERNLTISGDIDAKTAIRLGDLLGINYLLAGAVTEYGETDASYHSAGERVFAAAVNTRLIDTSTGKSVWTDKARVEVEASKVSIGGSGGGVQDQQRFNEVMKPAIQQLAASLKSANL
jgi:curli biogenesis system outer membrane secretion channel CsgG